MAVYKVVRSQSFSASNNWLVALLALMALAIFARLVLAFVAPDVFGSNHSLDFESDLSLGLGAGLASFCLLRFSA